MSSVLILGGGVSGLSAGIHCLLEGFDVTICEKHFIAGGNLTGWNRNGYHIDNCVHWLCGTNPNAAMYKTWKNLGVIEGPDDIIFSDIFYTSSHNGVTATFYRDLEKTRKEILEKFPEDKKEIKSFFKAIETYQGIAGLRGEAHNKRNTFFELISGLPSLVRYYFMSIKDLKKHFVNPVLAEFIGDLFMSQNFTVLAMVMTLGAFCADNAGLPVGGSVKMEQKIEKKFLELGGKLLTGKEAVKINLEGKRAKSVAFKDGTELSADYVIASMDTKMLFNKLLDVKMPSYLAKKYESKKHGERFSSFHVALSCDLETVPFKGNYMFSVPDDCELGLENHRSFVREYGYCPEFSVPGTNILQTMTFCKEAECLRFIKLREENISAYRELKANIADKYLGVLENTFPELKGHLKVIDVWTPATYKRYVGSEVGTWMGFVLGPKVVPSMLQSIIPGVNNVLISSQWLQAPGGLPVAAGAGKSAAKALKDIYEFERETIEKIEKTAMKATKKLERYYQKTLGKMQKFEEKKTRRLEKTAKKAGISVPEEAKIQRE